MTMTQHLIRAFILTGFAMFIVYLFHTGDITLYIAPRMELLVKLSALGLYAAAVYQFYAALRARIIKRSAEACECGHDHSPSKLKSAMIYGLFLFPLILGFLVPTGTLGSALAAKKGISFTGSEVGVRTEARLSGEEANENSGSTLPASDDLDALFPFDEFTVDHAALGKRLFAQPIIRIPEHQFIETLTALDLYREAFIGKEIEISGFVYREEEMGAERLAVSRFAMNCCSADALPYGLMIQWPKASGYAEDEWVKATGTLATSNYMGNEILTLTATRIERIEAPESPYVYPDLEFGL
ncbi:TIGR03943 family protein [Paenibacillus sp. LHD-117]|uniref:TIGR03943 family putative permease subunit n=1 Tax=Paenibacillus sp. LHD-117 TaxID=3071412 RepID=UPI0027DEB0C4|nr:TIGR03943 family protein [Paenibacillus sp. LHD-117]MDQ6419814.1 TIGR03943 family protein [Paenibacillus sp. LHD-117]